MWERYSRWWHCIYRRADLYSFLQLLFVRKQGQCEHPEVALHMILEAVGVGELALELGEDTGALYEAGVSQRGLSGSQLLTAGSRRIEVNIMERKSLFVFKVFIGWLFENEALVVFWKHRSWGGTVERGARRDSWNRPLLPCRKGMDFIPSLLLGKTLCDKGYSFFISAQHIAKH